MFKIGTEIKEIKLMQIMQMKFGHVKPKGQVNSNVINPL